MTEQEARLLDPQLWERCRRDAYDMECRCTDHIVKDSDVVRTALRYFEERRNHVGG